VSDQETRRHAAEVDYWARKKMSGERIADNFKIIAVKRGQEAAKFLHQEVIARVKEFKADPRLYRASQKRHALAVGEIKSSEPGIER
jgi:hypothetical protein